MNAIGMYNAWSFFSVGRSFYEKGSNHDYLALSTYDESELSGIGNKNNKLSFYQITTFFRAVLQDTTVLSRDKARAISGYTRIVDHFEMKERGFFSSLLARIYVCVARYLIWRAESQYGMEKFLESQISRKDFEFAKLYIDTYPVEGYWTFVENEVTVGENVLPRGWHEQDRISAFFAPKGQEEIYANTVKAVIEKSKETDRDLSNSRSVPAFSNAHLKISCKETSVEMVDFITKQVVRLPNAEFGFQYRKFDVGYLLAQANNDQERIKKWTEAASTAIAKTKEKNTSFTTDLTTDCQHIGGEEHCPMQGYTHFEVDVGSEAHFWETKARYLAMDEAVEAKLKARPDLVLRLLNTLNHITFIKPDMVWGTGVSPDVKMGEDALGKAYEKIRDKLIQMDVSQLAAWQTSPTGDLKAWQGLIQDYKRELEEG